MYEEHFDKMPETKDAAIRPYQAKDISIIVAMCVKYIPELPNYLNTTIDPTRLTGLLKHHSINSMSFGCWVLVDENDLPIGLIGATINPSFLTNDKIAHDSWLFVLPNWRTIRNANKLITAYKTWALKMGCVLIKGSCTGGYKEEEMAILMERNGFTPSGRLFHIRADHGYITDQLAALKG